MSFKFDYKGSTLSKNLNNFGDKFGALILMYCATKSSEMESYMKSNRPWTDRTGMAKATLSARTSQLNAYTVRVTLAYGVSYGIFLELSREKKNAIIEPTINKFSPDFMKDLNKIIELISF